MSRLVDLFDPNPFEKFAIRLSRSRDAIERAYLTAWEASDECNRLMKQVHFAWEATRTAFTERSPVPSFDGKTPAEHADEMLQRATAEDQHCDLQASIVIHFADDILQEFGRGVLGRPVGYRQFGKAYNNGVHLTEMLRATTANGRHLSEWVGLSFPYPKPEHLKKGDPRRQAIRSIDILRRAFGVGENGPIRDVSTWRALCTIDQLYGTHPPDYSRVESTIIEAARSMASNKPGAVEELNAELRRRSVIA